MGPWQIVVHSELILYFFWEGERRPHNLQPSSTLPPLFQTLPHNEVLIGYFLITPSLFFKARLSVKLLINLVFTWMVLHLASFSKWEYLELSNSLCCCHLLETGPPFVQCVIIWPTQISSRLQGKWNTFLFDYFKTLSNGPPTPPGIEPATSCPAFKRSTDWASPGEAAGNTHAFLTKLFLSRWLDIGLVLFCVFFWPRPGPRMNFGQDKIIIWPLKGLFLAGLIRDIPSGQDGLG